jgi:hypothetical protein
MPKRRTKAKKLRRPKNNAEELIEQVMNSVLGDYGPFDLDMLNKFELPEISDESYDRIRTILLKHDYRNLISNFLMLQHMTAPQEVIDLIPEEYRHCPERGGLAILLAKYNSALISYRFFKDTLNEEELTELFELMKQTNA